MYNQITACIKDVSHKEYWSPKAYLDAGFPMVESLMEVLQYGFFLHLPSCPNIYFFNNIFLTKQ